MIRLTTFATCCNLVKESAIYAQVRSFSSGLIVRNGFKGPSDGSDEHDTQNINSKNIPNSSLEFHNKESKITNNLEKGVEENQESLVFPPLFSSNSIENSTDDQKSSQPSKNEGSKPLAQSDSSSNSGTTSTPPPDNKEADLIALLMRSVAIIARSQNSLSNFDGLTLRDALYPPSVGPEPFRNVPNPSALNKLLNNIMISFVNREYEKVGTTNTFEVSEIHANPSMDPDRIKHLMANHSSIPAAKNRGGSAFKMGDVHGLGHIPTPPDIKKHLDRFVIGQDEMKKTLSVAVYQHYIRTELSNKAKLNNENKVNEPKLMKKMPRLQKNNVLILGPTGTGKTLVAKTIADLLNVPYSINDATTLTEAGYVGEDVEVCLSRLLTSANNDVETAERGIVFIDEIDKLASLQTTGRDVSGTSVQQGLLGLLEARKVSIPGKNGRAKVEIDTTNILFILSGAFPGLENIIARRVTENSFGFHAKESLQEKRKEDNILQIANTEDLRRFGLIPELVGRLPIITATKNLSEEELMSILVTPEDAIVSQFQVEFAAAGLELYVSKGALREFSKQAKKLATGARGLRNLLFTVIKPYLYDYSRSQFRYVSLTSKIVKQTLESKTSVQSDPSIVFKANQREDALSLLSKDQDVPQEEISKTDEVQENIINPLITQKEVIEDIQVAVQKSKDNNKDDKSKIIPFNNYYGPSMQLLHSMNLPVISHSVNKNDTSAILDKKTKLGRSQDLNIGADKHVFNWKSSLSNNQLNSTPNSNGIRLRKIQEARVPLMRVLKSLKTEDILKLAMENGKKSDSDKPPRLGRRHRRYKYNNNSNSNNIDSDNQHGFSPRALNNLSKYVDSEVFGKSDLYLHPNENNVTIVRGSNEYHESILKGNNETKNDSINELDDSNFNDIELDDEDIPEPDVKKPSDDLNGFMFPPGFKIPNPEYIVGAKDINKIMPSANYLENILNTGLNNYTHKGKFDNLSKDYAASTDGSVDENGFLISSDKKDDLSNNSVESTIKPKPNKLDNKPTKPKISDNKKDLKIPTASEEDE